MLKGAHRDIYENECSHKADIKSFVEISQTLLWWRGQDRWGVKKPIRQEGSGRKTERMKSKERLKGKAK